jgi:hypothetical protein
MEYRNKAGKLFWSDVAAISPVKAIEFALNKLDDPYERQDFLIGWREGDVGDWPAFFEFIGGDNSPAAPLKPERWYLGAMNDAIFIINRRPSPAGTDVEPHMKEDGATLILRTHPLARAEAQAIVDAHNATVA